MLLEREKGCGTVRGWRRGAVRWKEGEKGARGGARGGARRFGFVTGAAVSWWPGTKVVKRPFRDGKRGDAG